MTLIRARNTDIGQGFPLFRDVKLSNVLIRIGLHKIRPPHILWTQRAEFKYCKIVEVIELAKIGDVISVGLSHIDLD